MAKAYGVANNVSKESLSAAASLWRESSGENISGAGGGWLAKAESASAAAAAGGYARRRRRASIYPAAEINDSNSVEAMQRNIRIISSLCSPIPK